MPLSFIYVLIPPSITTGGALAPPLTIIFRTPRKRRIRLIIFIPPKCSQLI